MVDEFLLKGGGGYLCGMVAHSSVPDLFGPLTLKKTFHFLDH